MSKLHLVENNKTICGRQLTATIQTTDNHYADNICANCAKHVTITTKLSCDTFDSLVKDNFTVLPLASGGDYSGSTMIEKSNYETLYLNNCYNAYDKGVVPDFIFCNSYHFFGFQVAYRTSQADNRDSVVYDVLCSLENCPILDENVHSDMIANGESEAWDSWVKTDFAHELNKSFDPHGLDVDSLFGEQELQDIFNAACDLSNEYYINESSDSMWINIEKVVPYAFVVNKIDNSQIDTDLRIRSNELFQECLTDIPVYDVDGYLENYSQYSNDGNSLEWHCIKSALLELDLVALLGYAIGHYDWELRRNYTADYFTESLNDAIKNGVNHTHCFESFEQGLANYLTNELYQYVINSFEYPDLQIEEQESECA
jgi:hypothetical protein